MTATVGPKPPLTSANLRKCGAELSQRELYDARIAAGLTQESAAIVLGVSVQTIRRQEDGESRVDAGLIHALRIYAAEQRKTGT